MSRRCELTGIDTQFGNNVSHSQRKTCRAFKPNVRKSIFISYITNEKYKLKIASKTMRTIRKQGGFDNFMLNLDNKFMSINAKRIKKKIFKAKRENKRAV